jgi:hypothetical protein
MELKKIQINAALAITLLNQTLKPNAYILTNNPLKPSGNYTVILTIFNTILCIYGFHMLLTVNSDYFLKHR